MATLTLDGHFRELNRAFSDLIGYSEAEFKQAVWPPVMDRANLPKHRDQMKHLLEGKIESAEINTGYVHAQGLLVPLAGTIKMVRRDDDSPTTSCSTCARASSKALTRVSQSSR